MNAEIIESEPMLLGIDLERPFPLGFGSLYYLPRVLLRISAIDEGKMVEGIGEASIDFPFSTYDAWDIYWALTQLNLSGKKLDRQGLLEDDQHRREVLERFPAAFAAINMALDDVSGKVENRSILEMYGQKRARGKALASISFQDETAYLLREVAGRASEGLIPKPKVGVSKEEDVRTITAVSAFCNEKRIPFVLDFNAKYDPDEFKAMIVLLKGSNVDLSQLLFMEQPTDDRSNIEGLIEAREALISNGYEIPVMADESFVTLEDAIKCAQSGISLNFKIHKVGGLYYAREIEEAMAPFSTSGNMVGGTFPTAIGRVYDQQAASVLETTTSPGDGWEPSTDWFSGSKHLINEQFHSDPETGTFLPLRGSGLGITPNWKKINSFKIIDPRAEYSRIRQGQDGQSIRISLNPGQTYPRTYKEKTGREPDWNL